MKKNLKRITKFARNGLAFKKKIHFVVARSVKIGQRCHPTLCLCTCTTVHAGICFLLTQSSTCVKFSFDVKSKICMT